MGILRNLYVRLRGLWLYRASLPRLSARAETSAILEPRFSMRQSLGSSKHVSEKRKNLSVAITKMGQVFLAPGDEFSFWQRIGLPDSKVGFVKSRVILRGREAFAEGGGLCQLSGLIYLLALQSGLEVRERHPHSIDLYASGPRYAPAGSDATVVYGYKDLRIRNTLRGAVCMKFYLGPNDLSVELSSELPLPSRTLTFAVDGDRVSTWAAASDGRMELLWSDLIRL